MLIKNMEDNLVNGSLGKIVAFMDEATFDYYRNNEDEFTGDGKEGNDDDDMTGQLAPGHLQRPFIAAFLQKDSWYASEL